MGVPGATEEAHLTTVLVLNRVTPRSEAVLGDYTRLLTDAVVLGPIVVIDEQTIDPATGRLPFGRCPHPFPAGGAR